MTIIFIQENVFEMSTIQRLINSELKGLKSQLQTTHVINMWYDAPYTYQGEN